MSRRKRKQEAASQGAPEWMVTFGDLMSLLLTFFVLLFSVSEIKEQKIFEVIRSIRTFWNVTAPTTGFHMEDLSDVVNALAEKAHDIPDQKEGKEGKSSQEVDNPFGKYTQVAKIDDNLRLNIEGSVLFDEGSAELKEEGRTIIRKIRDRLAGYPNRIEVVGHTSPEPLSGNSPYESHYELGIQRARAVASVLTAGETKGIREERLKLSTLGRNKPKQGVNIFDPLDRSRLRRVEIIVTPENALRAFADGA